ncbi:hypothetical protein B0H16DRAFT_1441414 [Mycena metata]|uniref:Uncharacterized protein n=1 Tax=Mycena metata TaxID=1033252 RepID=A0AAD7GPZ1_9AGAR|nr:hypothetical protein B0H16DRAFT_1441414 [Mycena metata]
MLQTPKTSPTRLPLGGLLRPSLSKKLTQIHKYPLTNSCRENIGEAQWYPCPGLKIVFPPGQNAHLSYPFAAHAKEKLWDYSTKGDQFFLHATNCTGVVNSPRACQKCNKLRSNEILAGIVERIRDGVKEHTAHHWYPIGGLVQKLGRKNDQNSELRLTNLNDARKLVAKIAELDVHKQLMMAIASGEVTRVVPLLQAGINNGESARALLERFYRACVDVYREGPTYNPKGFTSDEYMVGICVLRLGGARLADILHRALGLPGLTTLRKHAIIRPLRASPALPTVEEIEENIDAYTDGEEMPTGPPRIVHRVIMLDKIAVERRARWDDKTNMILGACREHASKVPLEFVNMDDAIQFFEAVTNDEVHLATEATVVALGALSRNPRDYNPQPICISGTCKHETGPEQAEFLQTLHTAAQNRLAHGNITYRDVSVASDGEAKRGVALVREYMKYDLKKSSVGIYPLLKPLEFMNLRVGPDDITPDKDFRHVMKTVCGLLMRKAGIKLLGFWITPAIVKQHLRAVGNSKERVDGLLNPNDKQDVSLGYQLLKELWSLPDALPSDKPGLVSARKALKIFGQLGHHLVMPYVCITLTLREQLVHLSAAAHLLLLLFTTNRAGTEFMANQTFVNIMLMIKNAFFCVAKAKIDIPDSEFFLILMGTDRLEKLFGLIRTGIGTDSNVDVYQLAGRASNLTEVSKILSLRPHWDRGPKRLKLPAVINANGDISKTADHVSPPSWIGDVRVSTVVPHGCWIAGRKIAEGLVAGGKETLERCAATPGFDMFTPLGRMLVGAQDPEAAFEPDAELFRPAPDEVNQSPESQPESSSGNDIDDMLAMDDSTRVTKHSPHLIIAGKKVSKATVLSNFMQGRSARLSTDRTRRVAGIAAFNNSSADGLFTFDGPLGTPSLRLGNPVVTMVKCEELMFLAIGLVSSIKFGAQETESIPLDLLPDGGTKVSYQILRLITATIEDDPTTLHDWRWSGSDESSCTAVPGLLIHPLNPTVSNRTPGKPTYLFSSETLVTLGATVFSQVLSNDLDSLPEVQRTHAFPYRHHGERHLLDYVQV